MSDSSDFQKGTVRVLTSITKLSDEVDRLAQERRAGVPGAGHTGSLPDWVALVRWPDGRWMARVSVKPTGKSNRFESWVARGPIAALRGLLKRVERIEVRSWD